MLDISTNHYLILSAVLFSTGLLGVMTRRSLIVVLMSLELMLNAVNLNLVAFAYQLSDLGGQVFVVFTVVVAAGEVAIGLGILLALYRLHKTTDLDEAMELKG